MWDKLKNWLKSIFVKEIVVEKYYVNDELVDLVHSLRRDYVVDFDGIKIGQAELLAIVSNNNSLDYKIDDTRKALLRVGRGGIEFVYPEGVKKLNLQESLYKK